MSNVAREALAEAASAELARRDFGTYCARMMPSYPIDAPHVQLIIEALEKVERGECDRLIISTPPQHYKSVTASQLFPTWYLGRHPEQPITLVSYSATLAERNSRVARSYVGSNAYPFPLKVSAQSRAVDFWHLDGRRGSVLAVGRDSHLTGFSSDLAIVDDIIADYAEAKSDTQREAAWDWFTTVMMTRMSRNGKVVVIGTRWAENDLVGRLIAEDTENRWTVLNLPALSLGADVDPLGRPEGAALFPRFKDEVALAEIRAQMGPIKFSALYQGQPLIEGGAIYQSAWLENTYERVPDGLPRIFCVDTALKAGPHSDYSVILVATISHQRLWIEDVIRGRFTYGELKQRLLRAYDTYVPDRVLIESAANGINLIEEFRATTRLPIIPVIPGRDSKEARAESTTGYWEAGRVLLPRSAPWKNDFITEHLNFPRGRNDDMVDASTLAVKQLITNDLVSRRPRGYMGTLSTILAQQETPRARRPRLNIIL